jgi:hypothetical protein
LETWADAATGQPLSWPATEALSLKFVSHHLGTWPKCVSDARHGMPADVDEQPSVEQPASYYDDADRAGQGAGKARALAGAYGFR